MTIKLGKESTEIIERIQRELNITSTPTIVYSALELLEQELAKALYKKRIHKGDVLVETGLSLEEKPSNLIAYHRMFGDSMEEVDE